MFDKKTVLFWPIAALVEGKSLKLIGKSLVEHWVFDPFVAIRDIVLAVSIVGLFECMSWAIKGSEVRTTKNGNVFWSPTEETYLYWVHDQKFRSDGSTDYPWGRST